MENKIINNSYDLYIGGGSYINHLKLFHAYFNTIPNVKYVSRIDLTKVKQFISENYKDQISLENYHIGYKNAGKIDNIADYFFVFQNALIINLFNNNAYVLFDAKNENTADKIIYELGKFIKKPNRNKEISFIIQSRVGLITRELEIKKPNVNIDLHYNSDFKVIHTEVLKTLRKPKTKGLFLFHGKPGTGKSTYIKYLINQQRKQVIFLSPKMAANLDNMSFTEFLIDNPNTVLVIEDAEDLIISRENSQNSQLSFLLNLTDGLIADSLGIQIIATFNTDLKNIDKALLRKGRLTAIYDFKELEFQKANNLAKSLNIENFETFQPMSLADIFNFQETTFSPKKEKVKIGF